MATLNIKTLIVGGGGGGGYSQGAGGGAGGFIYNASHNLTVPDSFSIVVGTGGAGGNSGANRGTSGTDSTFLIVTSTHAVGGGGGAGTAAGTSLNNQAQTGLTTAKALQAAGLAGMNGNIGGTGLNYVGRMVRNAQAAIRQRYAGMGMSGSTAEQQDLNSAAQSGVDMQFKIGQEMAQTGLSAAASLAGQSATIYAALMNAQTQKDSQLGNALASFAGAVAK